MSLSRRQSMSLLFAALLYCACAQAAPVRYAMDPAHTYPSFEADHMGGVSVWRGKFNHTQGTMLLDRAARSGTVDVHVDVGSVDFGLDVMNEKAASAEFFDVAKFPDAHYEGQLIDFVDGKPTRINGTLTLHGVTQPLLLKIDSFKCIAHPLYPKRELCGADALATFQRDAFGLSAGKDYGFNMTVTLRIQMEALQDADKP